MIQDWQAATERKIQAQQKQELSQTFPVRIPADSNDTEDDTVSSMEYDGAQEENNHTANTSDNKQLNMMQLMDLRNSFNEMTFLKKNFVTEEVANKNDNKPREPRPYLKRGAGLARFNLPTDLDHLPCRTRRKQPNVRNIKSKYTQETKAFASRKAEVKVIKDPPASIPASSGGKIFRPRTAKTVSTSKMSPVLKQIMSKNAVPAAVLKLNRQVSDCDSVEHSFKEKLSLQSQKQDRENKELEVFELLEGATLHSSFSRFVHLNYYILKKFTAFNN